MGWSNDQFIGELTIPTGATSGERITINAGQDGAIKVYDAADTLIAEISPDADVVQALDVSGSWVKLDPNAPSAPGLGTAPGLSLSRPSGDVEPASLTQYDDGTDHGLYIRSSAPVAGGSTADYAAISLIGRYNSDPQISVQATGTDSIIAVNGTWFNVDGEIISYAFGTGAHQFTPTVVNGGTAVFTGSDGWYFRVGDMIFVNCVITVPTTAGSGAGIVMVDMPTDVDRTTRQTLTVHLDGITSTLRGSGECLFFQGGSGARADRIRTPANSNVTGADLLANTVITIQGWYREGFA